VLDDAWTPASIIEALLLPLLGHDLTEGSLSAFPSPMAFEATDEARPILLSRRRCSTETNYACRGNHGHHAGIEPPLASQRCPSI
jgi:hypothetical protein